MKSSRRRSSSISCGSLELDRRRFQVVGQRRVAIAPQAVDGDPPGDRVEPGARRGRHAVAMPDRERARVRLLKGVFGGVEVAGEADEAGKHPPAIRPHDVFDDPSQQHRQRYQASTASGRTSTVPCGHARHLLGPGQRLFQVGGLDDVVAGELFLGLGKRAIDGPGLAAGELDAGRGRDRLELGAALRSRRPCPWPRRRRGARRRSSPSLPCSSTPRPVRPRKSAVCTFMSSHPFRPPEGPATLLTQRSPKIDSRWSECRSAPARAAVAGPTGFASRFIQREPRCAVDLWERLLTAAARWPFHREGVADDARRIEVRLGCPCVHGFSAGLPDRGKRDKRTGHVETRFFLKLAPGGAEQVFTRRALALGNGPGAQVLVAPEGTAWMDEEHLEASLVPAKEQQPGAFRRHWLGG